MATFILVNVSGDMQLHFQTATCLVSPQVMVQGFVTKFHSNHRSIILLLGLFSFCIRKSTRVHLSLSDGKLAIRRCDCADSSVENLHYSQILRMRSRCQIASRPLQAVSKRIILFQSTLILQPFTSNYQIMYCQKEGICEFHPVAGRQHNKSSGWSDSRHAHKTMERAGLSNRHKLCFTRGTHSFKQL